MTIPALIAHHRAMVLKTQFKKGYSLINQALTLLKKDDITIYGNYYGNDIKNLLLSSFNNAKSVYYKDFSPNYKNHSKGNAFNTQCLDDGMIIGNNEFFIFINNDDKGNNDERKENIQIFIDINGPKAPNIFGYDLFEFALAEGDKLETINPNNTYFCNDTNNNQGNGISCAYFALTDKDYFKKLKW